MGTTITMHGSFEPIKLQESFRDMAEALNIAAANGRQFVSVTTDEGDDIFLNVPQILTGVGD